jgi:hypothetical protein
VEATLRGQWRQRIVVVIERWSRVHQQGFRFSRRGLTIYRRT